MSLIFGKFLDYPECRFSKMAIPDKTIQQLSIITGFYRLLGFLAILD